MEWVQGQAFGRLKPKDNGMIGAKNRAHRLLTTRCITAPFKPQSYALADLSSFLIRSER